MSTHDPRALRGAFGRFITGVSVIAARGAGARRGMLARCAPQRRSSTLGEENDA